MKVLIVCSQNSGSIAPFILEQAESLSRLGVDMAFFTIKRKGLWGYLKHRKQLLQRINEFMPDIIHAHYGLSGLLANIQRRIPVITTYHGSDINQPSLYLLSRLNMILSSHNIFVSDQARIKSNQKMKCSVIPCGIDLNLFVPMDKMDARETLGFDKESMLILFAGAFDNSVKNAKLAHKAVNKLSGIILLELKGYNRTQVVLLLNAVDAMLMTSFTEGSPQIIKEAMACNCPIVSVDVGDVREITSSTSGCFLATTEPEDVADKLQKAINFGKSIEGRKKIFEFGLDIETVAKKIEDLYKKTMHYNICN